MIKTKTKIMGSLITALLALSAPLVYADNASGSDLGAGQPAVSDDQSSLRHGDNMKGKFFHKLNLTDDQKKQLKDIWQKQWETMKADLEQVKANREALTNELLQTTPDVNKINDLKSKLEAVGVQILDERINSDLDVKKILTPEQFAKYLELQKHKFSGRFHQGEWGHRGEGWGHWRHCRHHHRYHHGFRGYHNDGGYGDHHSHWNDDND